MKKVSAIKKESKEGAKNDHGGHFLEKSKHHTNSPKGRKLALGHCADRFAAAVFALTAAAAVVVAVFGVADLSN